MLPNLYWHVIQLGPITLQVWGIFVALGIVAAAVVAKRTAEHQGLNGEVVIDLAFWAVLAAFIGSRIFFVITEWQLFTNHWSDAIKIWDGGMSISGGFIGAVIASVVYFKIKRLSFWQYANPIVYAIPLGLGIGRLGCFFIFDHPGSVTTFPLGEFYYADGLIHHNHGLYLVVSGWLLFGLFSWLKYHYRPTLPFFIGWFLIWDGVVRFILDFDRLLDQRFLALTAAQWVGLTFIVGGLGLTICKKRGII